MSGVSRSSQSTVGSSLSSDGGLATREGARCCQLQTPRSFTSQAPRTPLQKISLTPRTPLTGVSHFSESTAGSSLSSDDGLVTEEGAQCFQPQTPSKKRFALQAPRTPLPKISLTPRMQLSDGIKKDVPEFPSPLGSDEDALDSSNAQSYLPITANEDAIGEKWDTLLLGIASQHVSKDKPTPRALPAWRHESSNSLAFSADGSKDGKSSPSLQFHDGYLHSFEPASPIVKQAAEFEINPGAEELRWSKPGSNPSNTSFARSMANDVSHNQHNSYRQSTFGHESKSDARVARTVSLFAPSGSVDSLNVVLEASRCAESVGVGAESLSDSDNEFILVTPGAIAEERVELTMSSSQGHRHGTCRRVKRKCRQKNDSPTFVTAVKVSHPGAPHHHKSTESAEARELLTSTAFESNPPRRLSSTSNQDSCMSASTASLFGMEIVQEEGCSASSPFPSAMKLKGSGSMNALRRRNSNDAFGSSGSLCRRRSSEQSLGSLGLSLDDLGAVNDISGRDLVTPPAITRNTTLSPPPLARHQK